ncbi:hypothetical protein C4K88_10735 [Arthrobacter pityocampae]|uniref:Uncharacterized protein n=2 Tax=Arthrobacter pityocampae TaxID=547334 RepID=A0A2S5IX71_9MICC|nr:hypothetical protein C4K88_10735 [Arthrobacter pityocampae]
MSNEEQAPEEPRRGPGPDDTEEPESIDVLDPDTVVLETPDVSSETLEPELTVSPDTLRLEEPALEPAQISPEVAEAASLDAAAAEARAVAAEAEVAGTLAGGPLPPDAPSIEAAPVGTAPAGGPAGDPAGDPADSARDSTAASSKDGKGPSQNSRQAPSEHGTARGPEAADAAAGDPIGGAYAVPPAGGKPGAGHPGFDPGLDPGLGRRRSGSSASGIAGAPDEDLPGDSADPGGPGGSALPPAARDPEAKTHSPRERSRSGSSIVPLLLLVGAAVVLIGLLIWLLVALLGGSEDEARTGPSPLVAGECLAEFTDIREKAVSQSLPGP